MIQINEKEIEVNDKKLCFDTAIKKIIKYDNFFIVLICERKEIPNNIIAYDYLGNELWRINDIVKAKIPRGYYDIEKISVYLLRAYYELGIIYDIDLNKMTVINEVYTR